MKPLFTVCLLITYLIAPTRSLANPSTADINKPLATHNTIPEAAAKAAALYAYWQTYLTAMQPAEKVVETQPDKMQPGLIAKHRGLVGQALRETEILRLMGEPAATDLQMRFVEATYRLNHMADHYARTPEGQKYRAKVLLQLRRSFEDRAKECAQIVATAKSGKYEEAEKGANKVSMQMDEAIYFLSLEERKPFWSDWFAARAAVDKPMNKIRAAMYREKMLAAIQLSQPNIAELESWIDTVAGELRTGGMATVDGQSIAGPQVLQTLSDRQGKGHAGLQRIQALRWALRWHTDNGDGNGGNDESDPTRQEAITWTSAIVAGMSKIVEADAQSVLPADVAARHQAYLKVVNQMASLASSRKFEDQANESLAGLIARNSVYESSVKNYDLATRDLMIFQSRIAKQLATELTKQYPIADTAVRESTRSENAGPGLYPADRNVFVLATLSYPSNKTMEVIALKLVGQKAMLNNVLRVSPTGKLAAGEYNVRTYGAVPAFAIPEPAIEQLKASLLVDENHPPLTLTAYHAIDAATTGNYAAVGGTVISAQLESAITRFATMTDSIAIIVPRGTTPVGTDERISMMNQMVVRLDVDPAWVRHDLGVVRIAGK